MTSDNIATVDRIQHNGHIVIKLHDLKETYIGYTTIEAKKRFREMADRFHGIKNITFIDL